MALYFLDYDLRKQRDYRALYDELARFKAVHVLESSWCFNRNNATCAGLRDHLKQFVDSNDGLCVTQVDGWATFNTLGTPNDI